VLGAELAHRVLGQVRVHLDLVDRGRDLGLLVQPPDVVRLEVRHADGPGPAVPVELLQSPPGRHEVTAVPGRQRPVDQEQVDVIGAQCLQAVVERPARVVREVVRVAQLGGEEDLAAGHAGLGDRLADFLLVPVRLRGVDMPVADLQGGAHGRGGLARRDQEHPETELRDHPAVVQHDCGYVGHGGCSLLGRYVIEHDHAIGPVRRR